MKRASWILTGAESLLGRELRGVVADRKLPVDLQLCGTTDEVLLTAEDDEPSILHPLTAETLDGAAVLFLAGDEKANSNAVRLAKTVNPIPMIVDLTGGAEELPEARLRAPMMEAERPSAGPGTLHVVAHSGALTLARFYAMVTDRYPIRRSVVTVLEPVSVSGKAGIDELHQQSVSLFAFQTMPKAIFDTQVAFNLLPRFGEESKVSLGDSERRLEKHLASLLGPRNVPMPSLRVVHAPVFHGYCFSIWTEFETRPTRAELIELFKGGGVDYHDADVEPVSNLGVAGQSGFSADDVVEDGNDPRGMWAWLAADNLRTTAENAVLVAALGLPQKQDQ